MQQSCLGQPKPAKPNQAYHIGIRDQSTWSITWCHPRVNISRRWDGKQRQASIPGILRWATDIWKDSLNSFNTMSTLTELQNEPIIMKKFTLLNYDKLLPEIGSCMTLFERRRHKEIPSMDFPMLSTSRAEPSWSPIRVSLQMPGSQVFEPSFAASSVCIYKKLRSELAP